MLEDWIGHADADDASKRRWELPTLMMSPSIEHVLAVDADTVDLGAVGGAEVDDDVAGAGADLGVAAADVGVVERDRALGQAADGDEAMADGDALARGQLQPTDRRADAARSGRRGSARRSA